MTRSMSPNQPPNPHAAAARAAMQAHMSEVKSAAFADLLERCFTRWPDMRRYADTARHETAYDVRRAEWREVVTVTIFDKRRM